MMAETSGTGAMTSSTGGSGTTDTSNGTGASETTDASSSTGDMGSSGGDEVYCTQVYKPVCGKDGETYDHPCDVPDGVGIRREGPCFGDCEGSCAVVGSPGLSMVLCVAALFWLRRLPGRRRPGSFPRPQRRT